MDKPATTRNPQVHSGDACFSGTRVPVRNLWDHLRAGEPVDAFLDAFPGVQPSQVKAVIRSRTIGEHFSRGTIDGLIAGGFWAALEQHLRAGDVPLVLWDADREETVEVPPSELLRERIAAHWGLSQEEAARAIPTAEAADDLFAATRELARRLRPGRIPEVVRRPAETLQDRSLLQLALDGRHREVREAVERMFELPRG